jgi:predicted nucleic acid-binding protein
MKPRIYVETSVISYLAARPSADAINLTRQHFSYLLWQERNKMDLMLSQFVLDEVQVGDELAIAQRMQYCSALPALAVHSDTADVAQALIRAKAVPVKAYTDAVHLAVAALAGVDFVASWNFRHIVGAVARSKIERVLSQVVGRSPVIATPEQILESY